MRGSLALTPIINLWVRSRALRGKEDLNLVGERFGLSQAARKPGKLVWLHGVSVGESLSLLQIVTRLRDERPNAIVLVTSGTLAAAEVMRRRLPPEVRHCYAPIDTPAAVRRFIAHWRPDLGIFVESELWPNLLLTAKLKGVRLALLSGRMSPDSERRWRRARQSARVTLGCFDLILARDELEASRLAGLGARVHGVVDLKFGAVPLPADREALENFGRLWAKRSIILAASTHVGEEALILRAFGEARSKRPDALLIIAPRHPTRGANVAALARSFGLEVATRTKGDWTVATQVLLADTLNEMGLWYRLAAVTIIGGSLVMDIGGHNPFEPARLATPVLVGPYTRSWPVYDEMVAAGGVRRLSEQTIVDGITAAWLDPQGLRRMACRAGRFVKKRDDASRKGIDRAIELLSD